MCHQIVPSCPDFTEFHYEGPIGQLTNEVLSNYLLAQRHDRLCEEHTVYQGDDIYTLLKIYLIWYFVRDSLPFPLRTIKPELSHAE